MCGITGYVDFSCKTDKSILKEMVYSLSHRGPDNKQSLLLSSNQYFIGLGHSRLSIIDLSQNANQPMKYKNYYLVFNGEIYNYRELRSDLMNLGHKFELHSDTEVILHAFEEWGEQCVRRFIGMFAFALYDKDASKVFLFRDRAGVKPLYYYYKNEVFLFSSELKSFHKHIRFEKIINQRALALYFDFGYIPSPFTIFDNTYKLEPGKILSLNLNSKKTTIEPYWDLKNYYRLKKLDISYTDAKMELKNILKSAFDYRMIADVPVGVFLSGGYDSTAVAAIIQSKRTQKIKTFTIGFQEGNNEAPFASQTANYLGTDHNEYICTTKEAQSIIPNLPYYYDEPFADSSAIPTTLVSQFAKEKVKVALSADGGDEIFIGYNGYRTLDNRLNKINRIPINLIPSIKRTLSLASEIIPKKYIDIRHKMVGLAGSLNKNRLQQSADLYRNTASIPLYYMENLFLFPLSTPKTNYQIEIDGFSNAIELAALVDYQMYLQNDILTKVDRATMSVSLEGRDPFLDHRIIEFVAQLPLEYKFNSITGKRILKSIVHEYIPKDFMDRPKVGFSLPIYNWLQGELAYLIDEYLSKSELKKSGIFNIPFLESLIAQFKSGKLFYVTLIWKILIFQMWYKRWMD